MTFDDRLRRVFESLTERLEADVRRQVQAAMDEAPAAQPTAETDASTTRRLLDSVQALGRARSLSAMLDTLASAAAREASRASVLTLREGRAHGWRFIGFGALDQTPPVDLRLDDTGIIANAARANAVASEEPVPAFAELGQPASCLALPIALGGEVVAVLYADDGSRRLDAQTPTSEPRVLNAEALEIVARFAACGIEAITAFKVARSIAATPSLETTR